MTIIFCSNAKNIGKLHDHINFREEKLNKWFLLNVTNERGYRSVGIITNTKVKKIFATKINAYRMKLLYCLMTKCDVLCRLIKCSHVRFTITKW